MALGSEKSPFGPCRVDLADAGTSEDLNRLMRFRGHKAELPM